MYRYLLAEFVVITVRTRKIRKNTRTVKRARQLSSEKVFKRTYDSSLSDNFFDEWGKPVGRIKRRIYIYFSLGSPRFIV